MRIYKSKKDIIIQLSQREQVFLSDLLGAMRKMLDLSIKNREQKYFLTTLLAHLKK